MGRPDFSRPGIRGGNQQVKVHGDIYDIEDTFSLDETTTEGSYAYHEIGPDQTGVVWKVLGIAILIDGGATLEDIGATTGDYRTRIQTIGDFELFRATYNYDEHMQFQAGEWQNTPEEEHPQQGYGAMVMQSKYARATNPKPLGFRIDNNTDSTFEGDLQVRYELFVEELPMQST